MMAPMAASMIAPMTSSLIQTASSLFINVVTGKGQKRGFLL